MDAPDGIDVKDLFVLYGTSLESKKKTSLKLSTAFYQTEHSDAHTEILIPHDFATDTEFGDYFGAKLVTYRTKDTKTGRAFNQHFFVDVVKDERADKMKVQNWDELLIVGDTFVPVLSHTDVLNVFHHVKVDGLTRFVMVIRRVAEHRRTPVTWHWYETSAVLGPDKHAQEKGEPEIQKLKYKRLENNSYKMRKNLLRFKITLTPNFLDIKESGITVGPLFDDAQQDMMFIQIKTLKLTKNIWQTAIYCEDQNSKITLLCSLCDHDQRVFLGIDERLNVVPSRTEKWFEYKQIGNTFSFKDSDQQLYLAFDKGDDKLTTKSTEYLFERFGLPHDKDEVDSASSVNGSQRSSDDDSLDQQLYLAFDKGDDKLTTKSTEYLFERFGLPHDKDEVDSASSVNGSQRSSDDDSLGSSGYGSFDKTSDTEMFPCECPCNTQLSSTNNCPVERSNDSGNNNRMTRSMSRQLSDVRCDLSDVHVSM